MDETLERTERVTMADDDDRQPPQAYDTVSPAGVGATTTNQVSPGAMQDLYFTGDEGLLDVAMEEMAADALHAFMESLPSPNTIAGWPDVGNAPPLQASSPAGVGSQASSPSFHSIQTSWESSPPSPLSWGSARLSPDPRTAMGAGARTAAGAGGDGGGAGGRGAGGRGGRGGRGAGASGRGGAGGGAGGAGGGGGRGGGGAGGAGGGGGGGGRRGRRRRRTPTSPLTPASNPATPRGSWTSGSPPPRTLRQADLQRRLRMMLQDQEQLAQGREIANVTMTNSIVTSYKQGGAPSVQTSSSRVSP